MSSNTHHRNRKGKERKLLLDVRCLNDEKYLQGTVLFQIIQILQRIKKHFWNETSSSGASVNTVWISNCLLKNSCSSTEPDSFKLESLHQTKGILLFKEARHNLLERCWYQENLKNKSCCKPQLHSL